VVVRDFKGRALIRRVWDADAGAVYLTDDRGLVALQDGSAALVPIGFRRDDVFAARRWLLGR
jgi:hypothetical protein